MRYWQGYRRNDWWCDESGKEMLLSHSNYDGDPLEKKKYIHNNPVESGIVEKPEAYLYSSAKAYRYGKKGGLLEIEFV